MKAEEIRDEIKKVAVIGTGMIGPDVSLACTMASYDVTMIGRNSLSIEKGKNRYEKNISYLVREGLYTHEEASAIKSHLSLSTELKEALKDSDIVVEAIVENLETKQDLFAKIESYCSKDTIIASSTSGLSPNDIGIKMKNRERILVMHFWNPPYLVPLVEIVTGNDTTKKTLELSLLFLERIGKKPVVLKKDYPGHIGNRLQHALFREAIHIIQEGVATAEDIDTVILNSLGPRYSMIGPVEYMDSVGLDLQVVVQSYLFKSLADDKTPQKLLLEKYRRGDYGAKTGKGFYNWTEEKSLDEMTWRQNKRFIDRLKESKSI